MINIYRLYSGKPNNIVTIKTHAMKEFAFLSALLLVIAGLTIGAILKIVFRSTRFPYTVVLFGVGLLIGIVNRQELFRFIPQVSNAIDFVADINPDLILYLFLPILIFDAAYELNLHIFKKALANATLLAVPGLVLCMFITGILLMIISKVAPGMEAWNWTFALMFGALISATDPVAVVALLHELNTSKRFSTLVDAESLLNDGTGIVCFMLFFGAYTDGGNPTSPILEFVRVFFLSSLIGYLTAYFIVKAITSIRQEEQIQNSSIILTAYGIFILSQFYLGVSGVITLVVFGLTFTYFGKPQLKAQVNSFMETFWDLLTYIANTLIFLMVGIVIAEKITFNWTTLGIALAIYIGLNLIRYAMIMLLYPIMKRMGYGLTLRESIILTWGGLRGALAMALALMVSYTPTIPETIRSQILFFTAAVVTLTLTINATTMRWLLNRMGLINNSSARILMKYNIQKTLRENSEEYLEKLMIKDHLKGANWLQVHKFLMQKPIEPLRDPKDKAILFDIRLHILDLEKSNSKKMYDDGVISKPAFLRFMNSLDELYDHDGKLPLNRRDSISQYCKRVQILNKFHDIPYIHNWICYYFRERICIVYELGRGVLLLQQENLKYLQEIKKSELVKAHEKVLQPIYEEIEENINQTEKFLEQLSEEFPKAYRNALTQKTIRMLLNNERKNIIKMIETGVLNEKDATPLLEDVTSRANKVNLINHSFLTSFIKWSTIINKK